MSKQQLIQENYPSLKVLGWLEEGEEAHGSLLKWGWNLDVSQVSIYTFPFSMDGTINQELYVSEREKALACFKSKLQELTSEKIFVATVYQNRSLLVSVRVEDLKEKPDAFIEDCLEDDYLKLINDKEVLLFQKGEYEWEVLVYPKMEEEIGKNMIPQKILNLFTSEGIPYLREKGEEARQILLDLGLETESEIFAFFATTYGSNLPNPKGLDELIDIADESIYETLDYIQDRYRLSADFIPLTSDQAEGLYLYHKKDRQVYDWNLGQTDEPLAKWPSFYDFLYWYADVEEE